MNTFLVFKDKENYIEIVCMKSSSWRRQARELRRGGFKRIGIIQTDITGDDIDCIVKDLSLKEQCINKIKKIKR